MSSRKDLIVGRPIRGGARSQRGLDRPRRDKGLLVLADGMGGLKAGEVASAWPSRWCARCRSARRPRRGRTTRIGYALESLAVGRAVVRANETIFRRAEPAAVRGHGHDARGGAVLRQRLTVAHVGDSRLYRLRDETFEQVTLDHSLVQELVNRGFYTPEEAREATHKNIVTRALGIGEEVEYDVQEEVACPATCSCSAPTVSTT